MKKREAPYTTELKDCGRTLVVKFRDRRWLKQVIVGPDGIRKVVIVGGKGSDHWSRELSVELCDHLGIPPPAVDNAADEGDQ